MSCSRRIAAPLAALLVAATFVLIPSYAGARERQYHAYGISRGPTTKGYSKKRDRRKLEIIGLRASKNRAFGGRVSPRGYNNKYDLHVDIKPHGAKRVEVYFLYGTQRFLDYYTAKRIKTRPFTVTPEMGVYGSLTNLNPGTKYYYKAIVKTENGETRSRTQCFITWRCVNDSWAVCGPRGAGSEDEALWLWRRCDPN
jgi:hypothetical protein